MCRNIVERGFCIKYSHIVLTLWHENRFSRATCNTNNRVNAFEIALFCVILRCIWKTNVHFISHIFNAQIRCSRSWFYPPQNEIVRTPQRSQQHYHWQDNNGLHAMCEWNRKKVCSQNWFSQYSPCNILRLTRTLSKNRPNQTSMGCCRSPLDDAIKHVIIRFWKYIR